MDTILFMAVDLGTSFIKTGVYDTEGLCAAQATEPVKDYRPGPGFFIQRGTELFDSVVACMKDVCVQLGERARGIKAIVFSGQMSGFMGVDKNWEDITTWSCSLDTRYMPYADRQMTGLRDDFLTIGGTNFPAMAPKYEWYKTEFPSESAKIAKYLMISGYVIGRLGNLDIEDAIIDRSYISWTGLADVGKGVWSDKICGALGLDKKYLPKIVDCNYICGRLAPEFAKIIGLPSGIPLVAGAGDKVAGCLGAANVEPGRVVFEASSYGEVSCCVKEYRPDLAERRLDVLCSAVPGEFYVTHFAAGSGITLDWFIDNFYRRPDESKKDAFARMEKAAAGIPVGSQGVMAIGLLGGSSMPIDGVLRGLWMGYDWSHKGEHFFHALLESFSYDFALALESADRLYPEISFSDVRVIGGGAKSPVWIQMNADVSGKKYTTLKMKDVSMWGAVILAGNAIGVYPDLKKTADSFIETDRIYEPRKAEAEIHRKHLGFYKSALTEMRGFFRRLEEINQENRVNK
jgi:xylulokinase